MLQLQKLFSDHLIRIDCREFMAIDVGSFGREGDAGDFFQNMVYTGPVTRESRPTDDTKKNTSDLQLSLLG